jgi:hypothetical protein
MVFGLVFYDFTCMPMGWQSKSLGLLLMMNQSCMYPFYIYIYIVRAQFGLVHMFILQIMHMMSIT